jgi:hypothetical protein
MSMVVFALSFGIAGAQAATDLPADYRHHTYTVQQPLVLEYAFGPQPNNTASLSVVNYPNGKSDLFFFHMHMNEITAKETGEQSVQRNGGTFMYLSHSAANRDMAVTLGNIKYTFDPNRIFTAKGLKDHVSPKPTRADLAKLTDFAEWVKRNILIARSQRSRPMVIALHNNTDDDANGELLSILTEKKLLGIDNRDVHVSPSCDIDNFYIATMKATYDTMIGGIEPNISLRLAKPRDIGYLSNWMIEQNIEYLNVETQHGDRDNNVLMVESIQNLFH